MNQKSKDVSNYPYLLLGFLCVFIYYVPYFILGQDAAFRITDFLDDEIIQYLYNGKYMFAPSGTIVEEWLSGVPLATIQPPTFTLIIFFKLFPFYVAILVSSIFGTVFAFLGMFFLCDKLLKGEMKYVTLMASVLFCILPYYPPYGLSSVGIPLVIWSCIRMYEIFESNQEKSFVFCLKKTLPYLLVCIFYALSSSLIWAGYFVVGFMILAGIIFLFKKSRVGWAIILSALWMILVYCFVFRETLINVLFQTFTSHRSDPGKIYESKEFLSSFITMFKYGQYHVPSLHTYILVFALLIIILGTIFYRKFNGYYKKQLKLSVFLFGSLMFIAAFSAFCDCETGMKFREYLGPLESFQLSRIYWLNPTLWYVELALSTVIFYGIVECVVKWLRSNIGILSKRISDKAEKVLLFSFRICFVIVLAFFVANYIIHHVCSVEYYSNVQSALGKETDPWTYREFFDHELFEEIESFIGKEQSEYRIGCVGFVPAIAQANGFYTVDAYSTNYPLEYKYKFRKVIEKELEKNASIKSYYDNWGSRCYIFSAELGTKLQTGKDENIVLKNLEINTAVLKDLGCDYIFSAVEIENAEDINLRLLNVFSRDTSKIEIFVYEIY